MENSRIWVQLPPFLCLGLGPAHSLCSAEAAAVFSSGCPFKHLCKAQQGHKKGQWDEGMCSGHALGELLNCKQDWLAPAAPLACLSATSSYSSTAELLPFPASFTAAHPSHFLLNYYYTRPESSVALLTHFLFYFYNKKYH